MGRNVPFEEQVRVRAYEIFMERATREGAGGSPEEDWLRAEAEVRSRQQTGPASSTGTPPRALADGETKPAPVASRSRGEAKSGNDVATPPGRSVKTTKPTTANRRSH